MASDHEKNLDEVMEKNLDEVMDKVLDRYHMVFERLSKM